MASKSGCAHASSVEYGLGGWRYRALVSQRWRPRFLHRLGRTRRGRRLERGALDDPRLIRARRAVARLGAVRQSTWPGSPASGIGAADRGRPVRSAHAARRKRAACRSKAQREQIPGDRPLAQGRPGGGDASFFRQPPARRRDRDEWRRAGRSRVPRLRRFDASDARAARRLARRRGIAGVRHARRGHANDDAKRAPRPPCPRKPAPSRPPHRSKPRGNASPTARPLRFRAPSRSAPRRRRSPTPCRSRSPPSRARRWRCRTPPARTIRRTRLAPITLR